MERKIHSKKANLKENFSKAKLFITIAEIAIGNENIADNIEW